MLEISGDLFSYNKSGPDAICITTNGCVYGNQKAATMGKGCALEAKRRWPGIQIILGRAIENKGNEVHLLTTEDKRLCSGLGWNDHLLPYHLLSFPTKHHWKEPSDLNLIEKSCQQVVKITNEMNFASVVIPRPGCGLGHLDWNQVRPLCEKYLDDRFFIITFA